VERGGRKGEEGSKCAGREEGARCRGGVGKASRGSREETVSEGGGVGRGKRKGEVGNRVGRSRRMGGEG